MSDFSLRDYQRPHCRALMQSIVDDNIYLDRSSTGSGKCLGKGTPVLMWDGRTLPVEKIQVGDFLMGPDSTPREVVSLARGREEMFQVTPTKGDTWVCNRSHLLSVIDSRTHRSFIVSLHDYLKWSPSRRGMAKLHRADAIHWPTSNPTKYPPYVVGAWLGDGSTTQRPCFTSADLEVIEKVTDWAVAMGDQCRFESGRGCVEVAFTGGDTRKLMNSLVVEGERRIPQEYMTGSYEDRLQLLAGILDTDGHHEKGGFDLVGKHKGFIDQVTFLARSLGFAAYSRPCVKQIRSIGFKGTYHRVHISGNTNVIPTVVPRNMAPRRRQIKSPLRTGFSVVSLGEGDYYGFELSGPDRLFLLGDFTVTHNTYVACEAVKRFQAHAFVVCPLYAIPTWERVAREAGLTRITIINYEALLAAVMTTKVVETKISPGKIEKKRKRVIIPKSKLTEDQRANLYGWWETAKRQWEWNLPEDHIIIFDECHKITGESSQSSRMLMACKDQEIPTLLLSATPYYSPLKMRAIAWAFDLVPNKLKSTFHGWCLQHGCFLGNYNQPTWSGDPEDWQALRESMGSRMGGINVNEIPGYPENQYLIKFLESKVNPDDAYEKALQLLKADAETAAVEAIRARQLDEWNLKESILAMAKDLILAGNSVPIIVNFVQTGEWLAKQLRCPFISGSMDQSCRNTAIEEFQQNLDPYALVLSMGAGSTSISLHDLNGRPRTSIISPGVNSTDFIQSLGRSWRNGALSKTHQYLIFAEGSKVGTKIAGNLIKKIDAIGTVVDSDLDIFASK